MEKMIRSFHLRWVKKVFSEANEPKYFYFPKDDDHMMEYNENLLEALNKFLKSI